MRTNYGVAFSFSQPRTVVAIPYSMIIVPFKSECCDSIEKWCENSVAINDNLKPRLRNQQPTECILLPNNTMRGVFS